MTYGDFYALPELASHFPLVFETGARWVEFHGHCPDCDGRLPDHALRGHVTRPFGRAFLVEAWGLCPACDTVAPFNWRLLPDLSMVGRDKRGEWRTWQPRRSPLGRLRKFVVEMFGGGERR